MVRILSKQRLEHLYLLYWSWSLLVTLSSEGTLSSIESILLWPKPRSCKQTMELPSGPKTMASISLSASLHPWTLQLGTSQWGMFQAIWCQTGPETKQSKISTSWNADLRTSITRINRRLRLLESISTTAFKAMTISCKAIFTVRTCTTWNSNYGNARTLQIQTLSAKTRKRLTIS